MQSSSLFLSLTPERVLEAVEAAGLHCNTLCYPLNSFENRVYEVELEDRTRLIAKFYRPNRWTREQILEEHELLSQLDAEEIPVCPVRTWPDGQTLHSHNGIEYCLFDRRGGRAPDEVTFDTAQRLGRLVGRMHVVGRRMFFSHRRRMCADTYIRQELAWLEAEGSVPQFLCDRFFSTARELADLIDALMENAAVQRVHGDLHLGNVLLRDDTFHLLDFDDAVVGPPVQDLWLLLPGRDQETARLRELFLEGYEEFCDFDRSSLRLIESLRSLRLVTYAAWLARRQNDPAIREGWPHFGDEAYWIGQTADLEEQLRLVRAAAVDVPPEARAEKTLSNKDYFWDWDGDG